MDLDELQSVRDRERQTDKLQQLRESFYTDAGEFVDQLRAERDRVAARNDDPYAPEATRLNDEIEAATQLVEDIYEGRIGKLVKAASFDAAGLPAQADGMTAEEQDLFDALVGDIERHREHVLDIVEGNEPMGTDDGPADGPQTTQEPPSRQERETDASAADAMGAPEPSDGGTAGNSSGRDVEPQTADSDPTQGAGGERTAESPDVAPRDGGDAGRTGRGDDGAGLPDGPGNDSRSGPERSTGGETPPPVREDGGRGDTPDHAPAGDTANDESAAESTDGRPGGEPTQSASHETGGVDRKDADTGASARGQQDADTDASGGDRRNAGSDTSTEPGPDSGVDASTRDQTVHRERVLVTEDVDTFVGFDDRDYDLAADDVVTLPSTNADILVERDAARRL